MIRTVLKAVVALLAIVLVANSSQAKGKLTTKYKYYSVSGSTAASLHRNLTVPTGFFSSERVYANITMKPSFTGTYKQGNRCRIRGFGINGQFLVRLPRLKKGTRLPRSLNRKFRSFAAYVRKHELTHRSIWTRCLRSAEARINRLRIKSCSAFESHFTRIIASEWGKCKIRNARFDALEQKRLRRLPLVRAAFKPAKRSKRVVKRKRRKATTSTRRSLGKAYNFN